MTSHDAILWDAAAPTCGPGGHVTTVLGIRTAGVQEGNPLMRRLSGGDPGPNSFAALRLASVALFFAAYWVPKSVVARFAVPLSSTILGVIIAARNAWITHRRTRAVISSCQSFQSLNT